LTVLVTGFPGFIGGRLVAALLRDSPDSRVVTVVEPRMADTGRELAGRLDGGRIEVLEGDITERRLGLSDPDYERLTAELTAVYHLAAIYDLSVPLELATKVNVDGTGNVLTLCEDCERLERLHYVSTAYVAGERTGTVYEHELALGQRFKNHYESTKFQAEVWVRQAMDRVPTTIYRPAIVVGDSQTGETPKFDGPYYMLRVISRAVRWKQPIPRFGRAEAPFNVVPVDFIIDAMTTADDVPELVGSTLHLVDTEPVSAAEVFDLLACAYAGRPTAYRLPPKLVAGSLRVPAVRALFSGAPPQSIEYLNHPVRFDTRAARELLEPRGVSCPRLEEYVEPLVRFFREHEDDPAYAPG
jgi:thioester reductase-like protein